jgi:DNA-binding NtrC family response regulator
MRATDQDHAWHPLIVLVEEETMEREVFTEYLESTGFAVLEAADTDAGLALLEDNSAVSGLVTDAHVPGQIDGCELAQVACERWPHLAVVMMSGHSDATSGPVPEGGTFISKPYLLHQLAPTLSRMIAGQV